MAKLKNNTAKVNNFVPYFAKGIIFDCLFMSGSTPNEKNFFYGSRFFSLKR